jgi:membrane protein YdbS with pleckstrin-like domain
VCAAVAIAVLLGLKEGALAAVAGAVAVVLAGLVLDLLLQRRVGAWGYLEREDDLLVRRGLMVRRLSVVPYGRMQFVDVTAGPVERSFGLATVRLHTAAAASDARIPGLDAAEAARLRDQLAGLGEARAAGL